MTDPVFAERLKALDIETSFEILARAKALEAKGREIIHLEIGHYTLSQRYIKVPMGY